jgi:hypothetical protein
MAEHQPVPMAPCHILDLPNEILCKIFRTLRPETELFLSPLYPREPMWSQEDRLVDPVGLQELRALRMTCRRLAKVGSLFLLERLTIDISTESVAILDAISNQPHLASRVRTLRVNLNSYPPGLAADFKCFVKAFERVWMALVELDYELTAQLEDAPRLRYHPQSSIPRGMRGTQDAQEDCRGPGYLQKVQGQP